MQIAEVIETKKAYKPNQRDERSGDPLALGSIKVRIGHLDGNYNQVRNVYARPANFNHRIPLIGEQVLIQEAPTSDLQTDDVKNTGYIYYQPINTTDDLALHLFPRVYTRKIAGVLSPPATGLNDLRRPGYTFPKNPKKVMNIQPFEGDDIIEGRLGQSIRMSSTIMGNMSIYSKQPTWMGGKNTDPIMIFRVNKPTKVRIPDFLSVLSKWKSTSRYTIEDPNKDESLIYMTSTQMIPKLKAGFQRNLEAKKINIYKGAQIIAHSDRIVINAKKDRAIIIGKKQAIVTARKVLLQTQKYKVDVDELMDWLKDFIGEVTKLAQGTAQYSTAAGPTLIATNLAKFTSLNAIKWNRNFKIP